jgi:bisanhydrobacterioruberin hydratase
MLSISIKKVTKLQWATLVAVVFHAVGLLGMLAFNRAFFVALTPLNLLLSLALVIYTSNYQHKHFLYFFIVCFVVGFFTEVIGVNTGYLFGNYNYGSSFGVKLFGVPLLIGVNWFITILCCCITTNILFNKITLTNVTLLRYKGILTVVCSALFAVLLDWVMEPVAMHLQFWQWANNVIPIFNYVCWFLISLVLSVVFYYCKFNKYNLFAVNLLVIQSIFFLILRVAL